MVALAAVAGLGTDVPALQRLAVEEAYVPAVSARRFLGLGLGDRQRRDGGGQGGAQQGKCQRASSHLGTPENQRYWSGATRGGQPALTGCGHSASVGDAATCRCGAGFGPPLQLMRNGQGNGTLADSAPMNGAVKKPRCQPPNRYLSFFSRFPSMSNSCFLPPNSDCAFPFELVPVDRELVLDGESCYP